MATHTLLPDPDGLTLDQLCIEGSAIIFAAHSVASTCVCPRCGVAAQRLHK